jgi:2-amino-4-hydroxy-6-hydroxymethyldihydropteridine diphosphokinase
LVLPHPELANRPFVLVPIAEIAPRWRHPVYGQTAAMLLSELRGNVEGAVIAVKDW